MPTYEYRCPKGHHFELIQRMSEEPRADCPECGADSERLLSAGVGFLFKGGGFYITDNRSASYKTDASKEDSSGPSETKDTAAGKAGKKDTQAKPDPKSAKKSGSEASSPPSNGGSSPKGS